MGNGCCCRCYLRNRYTRATYCLMLNTYSYKGMEKFRFQFQFHSIRMDSEKNYYFYSKSRCLLKPTGFAVCVREIEMKCALKRTFFQFSHRYYNKIGKLAHLLDRLSKVIGVNTLWAYCALSYLFEKFNLHSKTKNTGYYSRLETRKVCTWPFIFRCQDLCHYDNRVTNWARKLKQKKIKF